MSTKKALINFILTGLSEKEVEKSRAEHGQNVLTPPRKTSTWKLYLEKFNDPMIRILLIAATISLLLAFIENDFLETIGIFIAIFLATTVGFVFELDADRKFNILNALGEEQPVKVRRGGEIMEIPRKDVVVGDVVYVEVGDEVPADGTLYESVDLQIDESSLTGESICTKNADKNADDGKNAYPANMLLRSTMVMNGRGTMVVTAVGDDTEIGKVARKSTEETNTKTPLAMQLEKLAKLISLIGSGAAILAFAIFLVHDILTGSIWHTDNYFGMAQHVLGYFMMAVTVIVMAVPEGLPMAVTLALALNMRRMLKSNNLVRKLHASETMGAVTIICTDKTGTLTQNKMQVAEMNVDEEGMALMDCAIAANTTADIDSEGNGIGNPTEVALLLWLKNNGKDYRRIRENAKVIKQLPFSTEKKYMATAVEVDGRKYVLVKGAPEIVLSFCKIHAEKKEKINRLLIGYQQKAMRTLAFAYKEMADGEEISVDGLTFQAVTAISDPVRKDVPKAVGECQKAGIKIKIVTGDTTATAKEIARQIGCVGNNETDDAFITGEEFAALSDEEASKRVQALKVMSRARPADKQRLVQLLQKQNEVVAVTGDGTNDAPALNYAHVGLSLGSGTSVAKQASDITLIDDSFGSIVKGVLWGRSLYKNIQRFLFFQLVVNVAALLIVIAGAIVGTEMPLTVTQILWVNLIMDTFAAMALASLPPSNEVMNDKPRNQNDFILTRPIVRGILWCGIAFFIVSFAFLMWCERHGSGAGMVDTHELTLFFTTFVFIQAWNLLNAKCVGSSHSAFHHFLRDTWLITVLLIIFGGQWLIVTFGGKMFRTEPLSFNEWIIITVATSAVLWIGELIRLWKRLISTRTTKR